MCCPLSGGGGGSPSRSGSVCTAPPSVGRASCTSTSCPASTISSAAASPDRPPPTTATFTRSLPTAAREKPLLRHRKSHARHGHVTNFELPSKTGGTGPKGPRGKQILHAAATTLSVLPTEALAI